MIVLKVLNIIHDTHATHVEDAMKVYHTALDLLHEGYTVHLSFKGITLITSSFLSRSVGELYFDANHAKRVSFSGLSKDDSVLLSEKIIPTAQKYFASIANTCYNNDK